MYGLSTDPFTAEDNGDPGIALIAYATPASHADEVDESTAHGEGLRVKKVELAV